MNYTNNYSQYSPYTGYNRQNGEYSQLSSLRNTQSPRYPRTQTEYKKHTPQQRRALEQDRVKRQLQTLHGNLSPLQAQGYGLSSGVFDEY